jgi:glutamine amidotransferase
MCRLLGIVASHPTEFRVVLREAPRSLFALSLEHRDGWGVAMHEQGAWSVHKNTDCAARCARYDALASRGKASLLIAHIRQKTVGGTSLANTHPFAQGPWVFAHNGTMKDMAVLARGTSAARAAEVQGDTDSERLFAFLLTRIDETGGSAREIERTLHDACRALRAVAGVGAFNFVLSDGETLFAHRFGRSLYLLERAPEPLRASIPAPLRESGSRLSIEPGWRPRTSAVLIASERLTDEAWTEIADGTLLAVRRDRAPAARRVAA